MISLLCKFVLITIEPVHPIAGIQPATGHIFEDALCDESFGRPRSQRLSNKSAVHAPCLVES